MLIESFFVTIIAVFSVFGMYCVAKMLLGCFDSHVLAAVVLEPSDDLEALKLKIREADATCICGKCGVLVLIPESRENDKIIMDYVEFKGFMYFYYKC